MEPLCVPGTLDALSAIGTYVMAAAEAAGLDRRAAYRLRLAVDEIATNSISHGYQEAGIQGDLEVRADLSAEALTIFLEDTARPFDPRQTLLPDDLNRPLEERKIGGLGVYLTVQGVDTFLYERVGNRNRNIFVMNLTHAPDAKPKLAQILLVDDSELDQKMMMRQLDILGYGVIAAGSMSEALERLRVRSFDLILLDIDLPEGGTESLLQHRRADQKLKHVPVIMIALGGKQDVEQLGKYIELGGDEYLVQPFSALLLQARISACLELARLRTQKAEFVKNEELLKIEHDVEIGRQIQLSFLPETLPQPTGWELAARFEPAREVAGDFYDAFMMTQNRRLGFLIGDVCDKGVGAALFMTIFRSMLKAFAEQNYPERDLYDSLSDDAPSPVQRKSVRGIGATALKEAMLRTNNYVIENHGKLGMFATVFFGVLDPASGLLFYINGGHNPPAIVRGGMIQERLKPSGPAVGLFPDGPFEVKKTELAAGDLLYLFTDGVTDAKSPAGERFSEKRLLSLITQPVVSPAALLSGIEASVRAHIDSAAQFDDITMMAIRRSAASS